MYETTSMDVKKSLDNEPETVYEQVDCIDTIAK